MEEIKKRGRPKKGTHKALKVTNKPKVAPKQRRKRGTLVEIEVTDDEEEKQELLKKLTPNQEIVNSKLCVNSRSIVFGSIF